MTIHSEGDDERSVLEDLSDEIRRATDSTDRLRRSTDNLASQEYVDKIHQQAMGRQRRAFWYTTAAVAFAMLIGIFNFMLLAQVNAGVEQNRQNYRLLAECLIPTQTPDDPHECYEENQVLRTQLLDKLDTLLDQHQTQLKIKQLQQELNAEKSN